MTEALKTEIDIFSGPDSSRTIGKGLFLIALFLTSLFATAAAIRSRLPFPPITGIEPKLAWLAEHGGEYDTFFVGSSRIFWQLIPEKFDAAMARAGKPTRSFNLAYKGVRPPEDAYILEHALARRKAPLRFVIVEAGDISLRIRPDIAGTPRLAYWHDFPRMWTLFKGAIAARYRPKGAGPNYKVERDALQLLGWHVVPFLSRATNIGQGETLLSPSEERKWDRLIGSLRDGYDEGSDEALDAETEKRMRAELETRHRNAEIANAASQELFADMQRQIMAVGARMIVVVPPRASTGNVLPDPARFPNVSVLDFSDPKRYPELYEARHRSDPDHLNVAGSEIFTRLVAQLVEAL